MKELNELFESRDFKPLYVPVLILIGLIVLSLLTVKIFFDKTGEISAQIAELTTINTVLESKLTSLQTNSNIASVSEKSARVLPPKTAALSLIAELKKNAAAFSVTLNNIRVGQEVTGTDGIYHVDISFETDSPFASMQALLDKIKTTAPIAIIRQIKLTQKDGPAHTTVNLSTYSSPFPEKLPAITEPLADLTPDERNILTQIESFELPPTIEVKPLAPQSPADRPDPFSL